MLTAYNLLRGLIQEAGDEHGVPSLEISFVETLVVVRRSIVRFQFANPDQLPRLSKELLEEVAACRLKRSRRPRSYPRVTKIKMSKWPLKRGQHHEQLASIEGGIKLLREYRKTKKPATVAASSATRARQSAHRS